MRFNPAFSIGAEYPIKSWKRIGLYESVNAGFLQNYWWMTALYLDTEFGGRFLFPFGFYSDITAGLGYMHYYLRRKTMALRDGECCFPDSNATMVLLMNAGDSGNLGGLFWNLWGEVLAVALSDE